MRIKRCIQLATVFMLAGSSLHGNPDPELQRVAGEIRQSVLGNRVHPAVEIERAVWDVPDGMSVQGLKQFFPKGCSDFRIRGSFECEGAYVVYVRFLYADFPFICMFAATFDSPSHIGIALFEADAAHKDVLWTWNGDASPQQENL